MLRTSKLTSTKRGILFGLLLSAITGCIYIVVLREPVAAFYPFAFLVFLVGPLFAGIIAVRRNQQHKLRAGFAATSSVFSIVCVLFLLIYAVFIRVDMLRVQIPTYCDGTYSLAMIPPNLSYVLSDGTTGILLLSDTQTLIVARVDTAQPTRPTTLYLIDKANNNQLGQITFESDLVAVAMDASTVHLFYDGLGHQIHKNTGTYESYFVTMDEYGRNNDGFFETRGVLSSWSTDGSVKLRPHLIFNGIARGCYIDGSTQSVTKL